MTAQRHAGDGGGYSLWSSFSIASLTSERTPCCLTTRPLGEGGAIEGELETEAGISR